MSLSSLATVTPKPDCNSVLGPEECSSRRTASWIEQERLKNCRSHPLHSNPLHSTSTHSTPPYFTPGLSRVVCHLGSGARKQELHMTVSSFPLPVDVAEAATSRTTTRVERHVSSLSRASDAGGAVSHGLSLTLRANKYINKLYSGVTRRGTHSIRGRGPRTFCVHEQCQFGTARGPKSGPRNRHWSIVFYFRRQVHKYLRISLSPLRTQGIVIRRFGVLRREMRMSLSRTARGVQSSRGSVRHSVIYLLRKHLGLRRCLNIITKRETV